MRVIPVSDPEYSLIEEVLSVDEDEVALEPVGGLECDEDDIEYQREQGEKDPIAIIELIAQWVPEAKQGIVTWVFARVSEMAKDEPNPEHGGELVGFDYAGDDPDFEVILADVIEALNDQVEFVEFGLDDEEE